MRGWLRGLMAVALVLGFVLVPATAQAGKQVETATLVVTKVPTGDVPPDATFTVEVDCPFDVQGTGEGAWGEGADPSGPPFSNPRVLTFDASGGSQELDVFGFAPDCTVTETEDGGATSTTYAAGAEVGGCTVTPGPTSASAEFGDPVDECEVVITNDFPEPPPPPEPEPAAAVVVAVQPAFTG